MLPLIVHKVRNVSRKRDINIVKMEHALIIWIEDCLDKKIPLGTNIIKQKALRIYTHLTVWVPGGIEKTLSKNPKQRNRAFYKWVWKDPSSAIALCLFYIDESQSDQYRFLYLNKNTKKILLKIIIIINY